jgi:mono/diheme cytochrome c family protein
MRFQTILISGILAVTLSGCGGGQKSSSGFRLPDGDVARGKATFVELKCSDCHQIAGLELPALSAETKIPVILGGDFFYPRSDGELVTAIINPSHRLARGYPRQAIESGGKSRMREYNDSLTIRQLADLVAFLHAQYRVVAPPASGNY